MSPAIVGSATLAIDESSTDIVIANPTVSIAQSRCGQGSPSSGLCGGDNLTSSPRGYGVGAERTRCGLSSGKGITQSMIGGSRGSVDGSATCGRHNAALQPRFAQGSRPPAKGGLGRQWSARCCTATEVCAG